MTNSAPLAVVDGFVSGDQFEVFDWGVSLGLTSVPVQDVLGCAGGDGPIHCLGDANYSRGFFLLGAGSHSITIDVVAGATGFTEGAAYFGVDPPIPEPATISLVGVGCLTLLIGLRRKRSA